ncbi:hypothetical protein ACLMJK_001697 [Lecanora helva]
MCAQTFLSLFLCFSLGISAALQSSHECSVPKYPITHHTLPIYPPLTIYNGVYSVDVTVGSQTLRAALDTGSSDTWFLTEDTNCTALATLQPVTPDQCGYSGPRYDPSGTFEPIPGIHFNDSYGTGEVINGPLGYTRLGLGGLTIPKAEISAATYASVGGDFEGNVSGLIGLSYPGTTAAYPGEDPSKDIICADNATNSTCGPMRYDPVITTLFKSNQTLPIFTIALSRSQNSGGVMTIGGTPHLDTPTVNATHGAIVTIPIEPVPNTATIARYYAGVDGFQYKNSSVHAAQGQYILDTGTSASILPEAEAAAINALFQPPAFFNKTLNGYTVSCNATAPRVGVKLGGQVFPHNPRDLIIPALPTVGDQCFSAIQTSLAAFKLPILGAQFLRSVLVAFDVGAAELTLWSRVYYEDS